MARDVIKAVFMKKDGTITVKKCVVENQMIHTKIDGKDCAYFVPAMSVPPYVYDVDSPNPLNPATPQLSAQQLRAVVDTQLLTALRAQIAPKSLFDKFKQTYCSRLISMNRRGRMELLQSLQAQTFLRELPTYVVQNGVRIGDYIAIAADELKSAGLCSGIEFGHVEGDTVVFTIGTLEAIAKGDYDA